MEDWIEIAQHPSGRTLRYSTQWMPRELSWIWVRVDGPPHRFFHYRNWLMWDASKGQLTPGNVASPLPPEIYAWALDALKRPAMRKRISDFKRRGHTPSEVVHAHA